MNLNVLSALVYREVRQKEKASRLGIILTFAEPVGQFFMMYAIFTWIRQKQAVFGTDLGIFLATGLIPLFTFTHVSVRVMGASKQLGSLRRFGVVTTIDTALARTFVEATILAAFAFIVLCILGFTGSDVLPFDPLQTVISTLVTLAIAVGVGLVNGFMSVFFNLWSFIYSIAARSLIFFSGLFYIPGAQPPQWREVITWNPILHCIEWFRAGFFRNYPAQELDLTYLAMWVLGSLLLGVAMQRARR